MEYEEALFYLKEGKKVRRKKWMDGFHLKIDHLGRWIKENRITKMSIFYDPDKEDLTGKDWEVEK